MITVLSEYKVLDEKKAEFLSLLPLVKEALEKEGARDVRFFEGSDQPGLFVEEFLVDSMKTYEEVKKWRYEEQSEVWSKFHSYIPGGRDKVHMWAFTRLNLEDNV